MQGRHQRSGVGAGLRWAVGAAGAGLVGAILLAIAPANASPTTVKAQLALSGVTTKSNPTGGSVIGIHPGDKVSFAASPVPTQGLEQLGLDGLLGGLVNGIVGYRVKIDFSHLPGGAKDTVLSGSNTKTFAFPNAGTYTFTWSAERLDLLRGVVPIALDGNELAAAGVKLNASNEYIGKVVVAANPPKGGISVQLPGVSVAPSLPVVGQLPTIGVPGVNLPTIGVPSVGNLVPTKSNSSHGDGGGKHNTHHGNGGSHHGSQGGGLTIPEQIVPKGYTGPDVGGGYFPGVLPTIAPLHIGDSQPTHTAAGSSAAHAPDLSKKAKHARAVDLATNASP
ncbi:MAG TPA: hypothetical protein VGL21_00750, partial [Jatrophihabitantaceae bacterium]